MKSFVTNLGLFEEVCKLNMTLQHAINEGSPELWNKLRSKQNEMGTGQCSIQDSSETVSTTAAVVASISSVTTLPSRDGTVSLTLSMKIRDTPEESGVKLEIFLAKDETMTSSFKVILECKPSQEDAHKWRMSFEGEIPFTFVPIEENVTRNIEEEHVLKAVKSMLADIAPGF